MTGERPLFPPEQLVSEETRRRWRYRIDWLIEHSDPLTDWESGFVQDLELRLSSGRDLTLAQSSKLNEIFHSIEEKVG